MESEAVPICALARPSRSSELLLFVQAVSPGCAHGAELAKRFLALSRISLPASPLSKACFLEEQCQAPLQSQEDLLLISPQVFSPPGHWLQPPPTQQPYRIQQAPALA